MGVLLFSLGACSADGGRTFGERTGSGGEGGLPDLGLGGAKSPAGETCNGLDDNGDGVVDEGCACTPGATQSCYGGPAAQAGVGSCVFGTQTCGPASGGEVTGAGWGPCEGWTAPGTETCGDGVDSDCDGSDCGGDDNGSTSAASGSTGSSGGDGCICNPGTVRWCDTPERCTWGKQVCAPDASWGKCVETMDVPQGCEDWFGIYDEVCCEQAPDACCQSRFDDSSIGECADQLACD
jgi:hypothetical protein